MTRSGGILGLYGQPSDRAPLEWSWVDQQLAAAGTYWVVLGGGRYPHPRPVWGVWSRERLCVSIGSPAISRDATPGSGVAVHLESGTDVVILEGNVAGPTTDLAVIAAYDRKYDWSYQVDEYGPLTTIVPVKVLAWRAAGWAGRESFQQTGRWTYSTDNR